MRRVDDSLSLAIRKAAWRLLPFLLLLYILAFLDRANVGFAKQRLLADTGLGEAAYAFGAGVFFLGYALFEIPSNLMMHRLGARVWMCRIMVTWGLLSAAMLCAWTEKVFHALRFLLGIAEAGFFPGVILYLTCWFPAAQRGRMLGLFYFGAPLAFIFGGPLSGCLMGMEGFLGLRGWQWMFLVEGVAASVAGVAVYWYLPNRPAEAGWLSDDESRALQAAIDAEGEGKRAHTPGRMLEALCHPRVLHYSLLYLLIQMSVYGVTFYLPARVEQLLGRQAGFAVGCVTAIPWLCALAAAWVVPGWAAGSGRPRAVGAFALFAAAGGIAASSSGSAGVALAALCLAAAGFIGVQPVFWTFPTGELAGAAAAGSFALINSFGAIGGFIAPNIRAWADSAFASASAGTSVLAAVTTAAAVLFLLIPRRGWTPAADPERLAV